MAAVNTTVFDEYSKNGVVKLSPKEYVHSTMSARYVMPIFESSEFVYNTASMTYSVECWPLENILDSIRRGSITRIALRSATSGAIAILRSSDVSRYENPQSFNHITRVSFLLDPQLNGRKVIATNFSVKIFMHDNDVTSNSFKTDLTKLDKEKYLTTATSAVDVNSLRYDYDKAVNSRIESIKTDEYVKELMKQAIDAIVDSKEDAEKTKDIGALKSLYDIIDVIKKLDI